MKNPWALAALAFVVVYSVVITAQSNAPAAELTQKRVSAEVERIYMDSDNPTACVLLAQNKRIGEQGGTRLPDATFELAEDVHFLIQMYATSILMSGKPDPARSEWQRLCPMLESMGPNSEQRAYIDERGRRYMNQCHICLLDAKIWLSGRVIAIAGEITAQGDAR